MHPKTINNLILMDFSPAYEKSRNYKKAFRYVIDNLLPKAKQIHVLFNGFEFEYHNVLVKENINVYPESSFDLVRHFKSYGVHSLLKLPRVITDNTITPLTKEIYIYPKDFYYVLPWIHSGATEKQIISGLREIVKKDLDSKLFQDEEMFIPEWFFDLEENLGIPAEHSIIVGGYRNLYIKELIYLFKALQLPYEIDINGIFGN
jgi:hypothetical protein